VRRLVIDSEPLIAFFYEKDSYHQQAKRGFEALLPSSVLFSDRIVQARFC